MQATFFNNAQLPIDIHSTSTALGKYVTDRNFFQKKTYIIIKNGSFEARTLSFWEKIDLFVQKLFNIETPDNLLGQIRGGFAKLKFLAQELGIVIDKNNLCDKAPEITGKLYAQNKKSLTDQKFTTEHGAKVAAIFLSAEGHSLKVVKDGRSFRLAVSPTNLASQYKLELHLAKVNVAEIAKELDSKFFGGEKVVTGSTILLTEKEDLDANMADVKTWECSVAKQIVLEARAQRLEKLAKEEIIPTSTSKQPKNTGELKQALQDAEFQYSEVKLHPKKYSDDAAERALSSILNARFNLIQNMG